jgi:hypothetical protein
MLADAKGIYCLGKKPVNLMELILQYANGMIMLPKVSAKADAITTEFPP